MDKVGRGFVRRCFLFAGHAASGTLDAVDMHHIAALAALGDVHLLYSNGAPPAAQRETLERLTKTCLFVPHDELDFGTWKRLIEYLSWDGMAGYDEVILVNNSMILLSPANLAQCLERFEQVDALFFAPNVVDENYTGPNLHLSDYLASRSFLQESAMFVSSFWALKRELLMQPFVQNFFATIRKEATRVEVSHKYERGFSRSLMRRQIPYALQVERIYPMSSIYTADAFRLVRLGVPYLKRKALAQEFYPISHLQERVQALARTLNPESAGLLRAEFRKYAERRAS